MRRRTVPILLSMFVVLAPMNVACAEHPAASPPTDEEIARLVRDLGEASYEARTAATLRLIAIGAPGRAALENAAAGADVEQSLRAKRILQTFEALHFLDTTVHLTFSKSQIRWDESVSLMVTFANKSGFESHVPFELDQKRREALSADALQVADMLDVAEWLHVFTPGEGQVSLRVDDISEDAQVVQVVEDRINGGPASNVPAGAKVGLGIKDFNRGWARFPLLDAGEYSVFLEYVPAWNDAALAAARVGYVRSNTATLTVHEAAPPTVSRAGVESEVTLEKDGDELVARLTNHDDLPVTVNVNFGGSTPMAQGLWVIEQDDRRAELVVAAGASWRDFSEEKLVELAAGHSIELARVKRDQLASECRAAGITMREASAFFTYGNFCDRSWQEREGTLRAGGDEQPQALRRPLPRRTLKVRQTSNSVPFGPDRDTPVTP